MPIDLGADPIYPPPSADERNQIRTVLEVPPVWHDHDDRYYTKTDIDSLSSSILSSLDSKLSIAQEPLSVITGGEFSSPQLYPVVHGPIINNPFTGESIDTNEGNPKWVDGGTFALAFVNTSNSYPDRLRDVTYSDIYGIDGSMSMVNFNISAVYFPMLTYIFGQITLPFGSTFLRLDLPQLKYVFSINGSSMTNFQTLYIPNLEYIQNSLNLQISNGLRAFDAPKLKSTAGFTIQSNLLSSINTPELETIGGMSLTNTVSLSTLSFPKLKKCVSINIANSNNIRTIDFPLLSSMGGSITYNGLSSLKDMNFPELQHLYGGVAGISAATLSALRFPKLVTWGGTTSLLTSPPQLEVIQLPVDGTFKVFTPASLQVTNAKLNATSVENVLSAFSLLDGTNGTTLFGSGKTITLVGGTSSGVSQLTPSASAARSTLLARGVTVNLNA